MSDTDFVDEDLFQEPERNEPPQTRQHTPDREEAKRRLKLEKERLESQIGEVSKDIDRLKQETMAKERERIEVIEKNKKRDEYVRAKNSLLRQLKHSLVDLKKEEIRAAQLADTYKTTKENFQSMLEELEGINEAAWEDSFFDEELEKNKLLIDSFRTESTKALAHIDTLVLRGGPRVDHPEEQETMVKTEEEKTFIYWMKLGTAFAIPLVFALVLGGLLIHTLVGLLFTP